ncbi:YceD family protein [Pseudogracilibacillus auburnensis]|uniref:YceD family protein n=1 Tax=Pseudogracilibacillus auburnensis TaxID=1494959 RepID=UPI001A96F561|nr:YceD family protein [Pseudogracilibacillus auburnensis]MBO1004920.1 DUF177 domain-containing protein [Pseudogracilibacillus auburnensis]
MKWTVMQLKNYQGQDLEIDESIDLTKELQSRDSGIRGASPIHVKGTAVVDSKKVTFHLQLKGTLILPCSRTLNDAKYEIDTTSIETFSLDSLQDYELNQSEEIYEPQAGMIDLAPIIIEILLSEVPMQVFCDEAINDGLLKTGNDWTVMTEEEFIKNKQSEKKIDPRLAGLADFFNDEKK